MEMKINRSTTLAHLREISFHGPEKTNPQPRTENREPRTENREPRTENQKLPLIKQSLNNITRHLGIFLQPSCCISKPFFSERHINPHRIVFSNNRFSQLGSNPVQHLELVLILWNIIFFNQLISSYIFFFI